MSSLRSRGLFIAVLILWAVYAVSPSIIYFRQPPEIRNDSEALRKVIPKALPSSHLNLGLDLQGGVQLVLGVSTDEAIENKLSRLATEATRWSERNQAGIKNAFVLKGKKLLRIELNDGVDTADFKTKLKSEFFGLEQSAREGQTIDLGFDQNQMSDIKKSALEQAERVIRSRIDKWGVAEPIINRRADGSVLVQLPGFKDPERAKEFLGRTAQLRFHIVDDDFKGFDDLASNDVVKVEKSGNSTVLVSEDRDALMKMTESRIPADRLVMLSREAIAGGNKARYTSHVLKASAEVSGEDVYDAMVTQDQNSLDRAPAVILKLTAAGGKRFGDVTGANVGKRLAIVLDDLVESAPVINEAIPGGSASIRMGGDRGYEAQIEEANQLVLVLKSGALPATVKVLEERQVGASLGPELASQGVKSTLVGLIAVFLFMVIWYRRPGAVACVALALNGLFLLALMGLFSFSLSLPGIAGFILTLGMAVDSNVLINERIRQELAEGRNARAGVDLSFKKVFWTIMDANMTTLIAAFVLLQTNSSGPIRGFAVTLIIGLLVSLFTALYCTRFIFEWVISRCKTDKEVRFWLGAGSEKKERVTKFDFLKWVPAASALSILCVVSVLGVTFSRGMNWAVDFAGGTEVLIGFDSRVETNKLDEVVKKAGVKNLTLQAVGAEQKQYLLRFERDEAAMAGDAIEESAGGAASSKIFQAVKQNIATEFASARPEILRVDFVGPQIGRELRTQGIFSLFWAILGILAYVWFRFDMRFSPGAVLKMFQDVFMALAFYAFFWRSFDLTTIAALLTVIGYSVNDVVVIYDRVRENLALYPKRDLRDLVNLSLNETLNRSIITSVTTLISLTGILLFGTDEIWNFAAAVAVGVVAATFSSTFIASAGIVWTENFRKQWNQKQKAKAKNALGRA